MDFVVQTPRFPNPFPSGVTGAFCDPYVARKRRKIKLL